jgi:hypothetical protein
MKSRTLKPLIAAMAMAFATGAWAEALPVADPIDGDDSVVFKRNLAKTPDKETEFALIDYMGFYVNAQTSAGADTTVTVVDRQDSSTLLETEYAKPLVAAYTDGHVEGVGELAFIGHGQRDVIAAVSLDEGTTWKKTNLSRTGDKTFNVTTTGGTFEYYGDVIRQAHVVAGNKIFVAWLSRWCTGGTPSFTNTDVYDLDRDGDIEEAMPDIFGVKGKQGVVDYEAMVETSSKLDPAIAAVGTVPFSCVWTARGTVEVKDDGTTAVIWRASERLTAGRRDANRIEVSGNAKAGFVVTWQEDPLGTMPGQGEGPGEGWSGATVNHGTDVWYSYIPMDKFDAVDLDGDRVADTDVPIAELTGRPKVGWTMSPAVRITDNERCTDTSTLAYCNMVDYGGVLPSYEVDGTAITKDLCESMDDGLGACVTDDGRVLAGRTGSSRPRITVQAYCPGKTIDWTDPVCDTEEGWSGWVAIQSEESKGLGELGVDENGDELETGKNMFFYTFDMKKPSVVSQGQMLNSPTVSWVDGSYTIYEGSVDSALTWGYDIYDTEIARRAALAPQSLKAAEESQSGLALMAIYKEGVLNQGGPADIKLRRFVLPEGFDNATDNPYAPSNMACAESLYDVSDTIPLDAENPHYLHGLCATPAINVSAVTATVCDGDCAVGVADPFDYVAFPKVLEWEWVAPVDTDLGNLDDQSWENPYDVAKGHRGFIDGDFVMMMYAWSPNWKLNAKGKDQYNLYTRRSFDGGVTWTTTPAALGGAGTTVCDVFRAASGLGALDCDTYAAGVPEKPRNVSLLSRLSTTVLDPRYSPTGGWSKFDNTNVLLASSELDGAVTLTPGAVIHTSDHEQDVRDPSKFFIVYETGDNASVALGGEAHPLDLTYAQASVWGDLYTGYVKTTTNLGDLALFQNLEGFKDQYSSEASVAGNASGTMLYSVWYQWEELVDPFTYEAHEINSDPWYRRTYFDPTETTADDTDGDNK